MFPPYYIVSLVFYFLKPLYQVYAYHAYIILTSRVVVVVINLQTIDLQILTKLLYTWSLERLDLVHDFLFFYFLSLNT